MKPKLFQLFILIPLNCFGQSFLDGKVYEQSSGWTPVEGIFITEENSNGDYSKADGSFTLIFISKNKGQTVFPKIGKKNTNHALDKEGKEWELINDRDIEYVIIPEENREENLLKLIVAPKGQRDLAAQKYYGIIKSSSDVALAKLKEEFDILLKKSVTDYNRISKLGEKIAQLEKQVDSIRIYKEALALASINKDDDNDLGLIKYLECIESGGLIQDCRDLLKVEKAKERIEISQKLFSSGIELLETRANSSFSVFDFDDALLNLEEIINSLEKFNVEKSKINEYYVFASEVAHQAGEYHKAIKYQEKVLKDIEDGLDKKTDIIDLLLDLGNYYREMGRFDLSIQSCLKGLELEVKKQKLSETQAFLHNNLGVTYLEINEYQQSLSELLKSLEIREQLFIGENKDLANLYNNLGNTYSSLGLYSEAIESFKNAISIQESIQSSKIDIGLTFSNLAGAIRDNGNPFGSIENSKIGIEMLESVLPSMHPTLGFSYTNIGFTYLELGMCEEAFDYLDKAYEIKNLILPKNHYMVSEIKEFMGRYYLDCENNLGKAKTLFDESLEIIEPQSENRKMQTASLYSSIALWYFANDDAVNSLAFHKKSNSLKVEILRKDHPNLADSYATIGLMQLSMDMKKEASLNFENALKILHSNKNLEESNLEEIRNFITSLWYSMANEYFQNLMFRDALDEFNKISNFKKDDYEVYNSIGLCHYYLENYLEAIVAYKKASGFSKDYKSLIFYNNLGTAQVKNLQFKDAFDSFTVFQNLNPSNAKVYRNWAMYHSLKNEPDKALENLEKAIELGFIDIDWLETDNSMDNLRNSSQFKKIISTLKTGGR